MRSNKTVFSLRFDVDTSICITVGMSLPTQSLKTPVFDENLRLEAKSSQTK
jgi:hypothetical protein